MTDKEKEVYKENEKQEPLNPPDTRKWPEDFRGWGSNVHPRKRKKDNKK